MPLLVVILVAAIVLTYFHMTRKARLAWLAKLDLPGLWRWQQGNGQLVLSGRLQGGTFVLTEGRDKDQDQGNWLGDASGTWSVQGHKLVLTSKQATHILDLQLFSPGNIGLEREAGERRIYVKETSNVVPLTRH
ncbi:MAG: hypothetical protein ACI9ON_004400 [Limisphaerales bacterium]|jgi:hypothetical protein